MRRTHRHRQLACPLLKKMNPEAPRRSFARAPGRGPCDTSRNPTRGAAAEAAVEEAAGAVAAMREGVVVMVAGAVEEVVVMIIVVAPLQFGQ